MIICNSCKKEMTCETTGVIVRFGNGTHAYAGDRFKCKDCGHYIIVTNHTPFFDSKLYEQIENKKDIDKIDNKYNIWMEQ